MLCRLGCLDIQPEGGALVKSGKQRWGAHRTAEGAGEGGQGSPKVRGVGGQADGGGGRSPPATLVLFVHIITSAPDTCPFILVSRALLRTSSVSLC